MGYVYDKMSEGRQCATGVDYCRYGDGVMGATQVRRTLAEWVREAGIHTWV